MAVSPTERGGAQKNGREIVTTPAPWNVFDISVLDFSEFEVWLPIILPILLGVG